MHATTNEVPAERLVIEQAALQALPAPYRGRSVTIMVQDFNRSPVSRFFHSSQSPATLIRRLLRQAHNGLGSALVSARRQVIAALKSSKDHTPPP